MAPRCGSGNAARGCGQDTSAHLRAATRRPRLCAMSVYQAKQLASLAQSQAIVAVNVIQRKGRPTTDEAKYDESLALAVANLSQAFVEFLKDQ